jgi:nitrogen fixation protein NifB
MSVNLDTTNHPCFNASAKGTCGRVHLPVAPACNIKCNYCNRKYDCVNESRPGVSSAVLSPEQAVLYLEQVLDALPRTTVAGIAGPGDAFATPDETMKTLRMVRERFPEILLCLATNGLNVGPYVEELAELNVTHVTITVNAVDPEIGAKIYGWVRDGKKIHRGIKAAKLLLERQLEAIAAFKKKGIVVKANTIVIPGINDHHVMAVAEKMAELGVDIQNCMPMYPNQDTPFEDIFEPTVEEISLLRNDAEKVIPQMTHCTRCRADAVGLLDDDKTDELFECLSECSQEEVLHTEGKPYVAVATLEGILVNQHLGEARRFQIWGRSESGFHLKEERAAPPTGNGHHRWLCLVETLKDCRAVLVSGIGETPRQFLSENDILPIEMNGFINMGLETIYNNGNVATLRGRRKGVATGGCSSGCGTGCG